MNGYNHGMNDKEFEIGKVFKHQGTRYKVVGLGEATGGVEYPFCNGCEIETDTALLTCLTAPKCGSQYRTDKTNVIYKKYEGGQKMKDGQITLYEGKYYKFRKVEEHGRLSCIGCCFEDGDHAICDKVSCWGGILEKTRKPKKSKIPTQIRDFYRMEIKRIAKEKGLYYSTNCTVNSVKQGVELMQKLLCEKQEREHIDRLNDKNKKIKGLEIDLKLANDKIQEAENLLAKENKLRITQIDEYEEILENKEDKRLEALKEIGELKRKLEGITKKRNKYYNLSERLSAENESYRHDLYQFRNKNFLQRMIIAFKNHL